MNEQHQEILKRKGSKKWLLIKAVIILSGAVLIPQIVDLEQVVRLFRGSHFSILISGFLASHAGTFLFSLRMRQVLKSVGIRIPVNSSYRLNLESLFYSVFIPTQLSTEAVKFAKIASLDGQTSKGSILFAIFFDRIIGLGTFILLSCTAFYFLPLKIDISSSFLGSKAGVIICIILILTPLLCLLVKNTFSRFSMSRLFLFNVGYTAVGHAVFISFLMQLTMCLASWLAAISFNIQISYLQVVFALCASLCFQIIPISFIGIGASEAAGILFYLAVGISRPEALIMVSCNYSFRLINSVIGGFIELFRTGKGVWGDIDWRAKSRKGMTS